MSIAKWNNRNLVPRMSSIVDDFWGEDFDFFNRGSEVMNIPAVNVKETESNFNLEIAAPGYEKKDFNVSVDNGRLCIKSESQKSEEDKEDNFTRKEFSYKSFSRSFSLPKNIDEEHIEAKYENGILNLNIPKLKTEAKQDSKFIEIS